MEKENSGDSEIVQLRALRSQAVNTLQKLLETPRHDEDIATKIENAIKISDYADRRLQKIYPYCYS